MKALLLLASLTLSIAAHASTPPEAVDGITKDRAGNLEQLTLAQAKKTMGDVCEKDVQVAKFEIILLAADSANAEKTPGTSYDFTGHYLVIEKCLYGSTFVGAYADTVKSAIFKSSFTANYASRGSFKPKKMRDIKIALVKEITETNVNSN